MKRIPDAVPGGRGRGFRVAADLAAGTALLLLEGAALALTVLALGFRRWGTDGSADLRAQDRLDLTQSTYVLGGLIAVAVLAAALAAWRRAAFTTGLQILAALALAVLLGQAHSHYDTRYPPPSPPRTGPACFSGSNDCP
ncbi:DUF6234 family protein [Kitasatospora sp. NPDC059646]|uniref:DUF6234 family protein n=1 Tax=Kitasatospora sp. NPDC059646 TaxID=3346893 RepID=UPI00367902D1